MAIERANDLHAFRSFVDEQLANGGAELKLDEALARWEFENKTDDERSATIRALKEALADMEAGDTGIPAREALAELHRKYHLSELS